MANFNGHHGCLKCTTVGEHNFDSNTTTFPRTEAAKRTNELFRAKQYGSHHKYDSPLLQLLDIDMIAQFPVADSLHLLHLGIMKRLLFGWRDGKFKRSGTTKWSATTTSEISKYLTSCKMPMEIHRAVRGLDCLNHWKGTEYRTFLHYVGIVAIKKHVAYDVYEHFLVLFCAVTICSSKAFFHLLPLAETLFDHFIEYFREIYGQAYMTSNIHNLTHVIDDVRMFGELDTFSAYPFENMLGRIKRLLKSGKNPLVQVAKRISEQSKFERANVSLEPPKMILTKKNTGLADLSSVITLSFTNIEELRFFSKIEFDEFALSTDRANRWFLTKTNEIAKLTNVICDKNNVSLLCVTITQIQNFFETPIKSSILDVFACDWKNAIYSEQKLFKTSDIKCKLVKLEYSDRMDVFVPLMHTKYT